MRTTRMILSVAFGAAVVAACSDDPEAVPAPIFTGPTTATGPTTTTTTTTGASTGGGSTTSTTTGDGGAGAQGGTGGQGGMGGGSTCPPIFIDDGTSVTCATEGNGSLPHSGTTECPEDFSVYWPAQIYEVPVTAGDCLHMAADNVGSAAGADLFGAVVDPSGSSLLFDEEQPCTVTNPDGFDCPAGAVTIEMTGTAYVMVGAFEGNGCPVGDSASYQLSVAVDGVDVDLSAGPVCLGDLQTIIP